MAAGDPAYIMSCRHPSLAAAGSELHRLCRSGDLSAIRSYLNETVTETVVNRAAGLNGCTPLHEAAMAGRADVVRLLSEECNAMFRLDVNVRTQRGPAYTPLHLAAERGHVDTVITLIECGASLSAVDRRCRTAKDVATEHGHRQVVVAVTVAEVEKATGKGSIMKMTEALAQLEKHTVLSEEVKLWKQSKLNASLKMACKLGNHRLALPLIKAGADNFVECIQSSARVSHILAFLRLCQAAREDDQEAIQLILSWREDEVYSNPRYSSLMQYNHILMPLIENGTLSLAVPIKVALKHKHTQSVATLLGQRARNPEPCVVDWHGMELEEIDPRWLKHHDYSTLTLICLSFNALRQVPAEVLKFRNLEKLQMADNDMSYVPSELFCMQRIENIDLSHNKIACLPEALLGQVSEALRELNFSNNQLSSFPDYFKSAKVTNLDISSNRFHDIPASVYELRHLEYLDISHNTEVRHIPYELGGLRHLQALSVENVQNAVNIPDKRRGSVLSFLQDRFKSMQTVTHYEVQVIGSPKYKALEGLMNILVTSDLMCSLLRYTSPSQFLFLYEIFRLPNVVYVIPWDCHGRQAADDLHLVLRHLSVHCPDAPVIVAACWKSVLAAHSELAVENQIAESLWSDLSDRIRLHHVLLEGGESPVETRGETSVHMLLTAIEQASQRVNTTSFVPSSYYNCDKLLRAEADKMQRENRCLLMSEWDFWELVRSMPSHDLSSHCELPVLVKFLCARASIAYLPSPKESEAAYVLSRQWYCHVLGNIITQHSLLMASSSSAIVRQEGLVDLFGNTSIQLPIPTALQYLLNRYAISLALSSERWLLPSMLSKQPDSTFSNFSTDDIRRQFTCTLVPITLMGRLINHLLINMEGLINHITLTSAHSSMPRAVDWRYWRHGIVCWMNACDLVYSIEMLAVNTEPFHQGIELRVPNTKIGHRTMHLLTYVIDSLLKNWYPTVWKSVEVWVPCSYCIHTEKPDVPSISFQDCLYAVSKGVGVKCVQHLEKIVTIAKIVPDLIQEDINADLFIPPETVTFNPSDKATCLSPAPNETVFKGQYNGSLVAVKPHPAPVPNTTGKDVTVLKASPVLELWTEFETILHLQGAKCPYIINMIGLCPQPLCLVFPFAKWSSLEEVISIKEISVPRIVRLRMVHQLAQALEVLHSYHVIHRHVSLSNLLVYSLSPDDEVNIKLAGFSDACYGVFQGIGVGCYGTFPAPEMLQTAASEYDERVDIFAFGFVAYEIITRSTVHNCSNTPLQKSIDCLMCHDRPSLNPVSNTAPYLCELLAKCWNPDPFKRPYAHKIVEVLRSPVHTLVQDGKLISEKHEFYAAAAKFTRVKNSFHTDVFICSGELTGQSTAYLTHLSLPDLEVNRTIELPSEFVISMGCVGDQLWVSFFGKKVRVYSTTGKLDFINEFSFNQHVVAIGVSPTSVYLGLENGVLQIYDVTERNIPTEPRYTKVVVQGQEFKSIEALEASVVCATNGSVYRLHPDTLEQEAKIPIHSKAEIRSVVISEPGSDEEEQRDTLWVSFRRTDQVQVLDSWTGEQLYTISCSTIVAMDPNQVWVYSLRIVLDTVWIGLNTGHILIFAANGTSSSLLSHLHIHGADVRQLLMLHPSYMGHMTILSASEMRQATTPIKSVTSTLTPSLIPTLPDSVLLLSLGTGLVKSLPSVKHSIEGNTNNDTKKTGLYAVVLEGMVESRLRAVERGSCRQPIPYMTEYGDGHIYDLPLMEDSEEVEGVVRADTWSADVLESPIQAKFKTQDSSSSLKTISEAQHEDYVPMASVLDRDLIEAHSTAPPLHPKPHDLIPASPKTDASKPNTTRLKDPSTDGSASPSQKGKRKPFSLKKKTKPAPLPQKEDSLEDSFQYDYPYTAPTRTMSMKPQPSHPIADPRRSTLATGKPALEDSGKLQGYDPYVKMGSVQTALKQLVSEPPRERQESREKPCELSDELDFVTVDEFLGQPPSSLLKDQRTRSTSSVNNGVTSPVDNRPPVPSPKPDNVPPKPEPTSPLRPPVAPKPVVLRTESGECRGGTMYTEVTTGDSDSGVRDSIIEEVAYVTVRRTPHI